MLRQRPEYELQISTVCGVSGAECLVAGVWSREANTCYRMGRGIQAGRVWVNNYHSYPAHAAFGGYKNSGIGRETHKMMLNHYQQTKNVLVAYAEEPDGFF